LTYEFKWTQPRLQSKPDDNGLPLGLDLVDWKPVSRPPVAPISGQYCRLEPFNIDVHSEELFHAFSLDKKGVNWAYLPYGPFDTLGQFRQWCTEYCVSDDPLFHTVIDLKSDQAVGLASYLRITPDMGSIEVGHIHFSPLMQRTRMATESMYLMMSRVFDELGYRRYEWKCNALNAPSCKAAERLGFQFEGIFRQAVISKNQNRDTAWFAIIDEDWPQIKNGFTQWLAAENFNEGQSQVCSLEACMQSR